MANVNIFDISDGKTCAVSASVVVRAAAIQTVPPGKDARMALRVSNGNESTAVSVILKAGDGPRAVLGEKNVTIAAGHTAYIALFDSARFKRFSDGAMVVELKAAGGGTLTAQQLESVFIEAVQL